METAAGAAAGLALRRLIDQYQVVTGSLLGPADLGVSGSEPVAEVIGHLVAVGIIVEVEVVKVAVVQRRPVAHQDGLSLLALPRAQYTKTLLAEQVAAAHAALELGVETSRAFGRVRSVEEEPGLLTVTRSGCLDVTAGQRVEE